MFSYEQKKNNNIVLHIAFGICLFFPCVSFSSNKEQEQNSNQKINKIIEIQKSNNPVELINHGYLEKGIDLINRKPLKEKEKYIAYYTQIESTSWGHWMAAEYYSNTNLEKAVFHAYKGTFLAHIETEFCNGTETDKKNILGTLGRVFQTTIISIRQKSDENIRNIAVKEAFEKTINSPPPKNKNTIFWGCYLSGMFNQYEIEDYEKLEKRIEKNRNEHIKQQWERAKQNLRKNFNQLNITVFENNDVQKPVNTLEWTNDEIRMTLPKVEFD